MRCVYSLRLTFLLISLIALSACSSTFEGDEFTFSPPIGFQTKQYEKSLDSPNYDSQLLIFSQKDHLYFQVLRQKIPPESNLEKVFAEYVAQSRGMTSHYQFVSQNTIEMNNQTAIEYVYRQFQGEPYVQRSEIWMEKSGWAYSLVCTDPADSTPGMMIPVSKLCIELVKGFQFK